MIQISTHIGSSKYFFTLYSLRNLPVYKMTRWLSRQYIYRRNETNSYMQSNTNLSICGFDTAPAVGAGEHPSGYSTTDIHLQRGEP